MERPSDQTIVSGSAAVAALIMGSAFLFTRCAPEHAAELHPTTTYAPHTTEASVALTSTTVELAYPDTAPTTLAAPPSMPEASSTTLPAEHAAPPTAPATTAAAPPPPPTARRVYYEESENRAAIFRDFHNASNIVSWVEPPTIVPVECVQHGPIDAAITVGGLWYRIAAGGPFPAGTYVPANTFVNGQRGVDGPSVDPQVPDCDSL